MRHPGGRVRPTRPASRSPGLTATPLPRGLTPCSLTLHHDHNDGAASAAAASSGDRLSSRASSRRGPASLFGNPFR